MLPQGTAATVPPPSPTTDGRRSARQEAWEARAELVRRCWAGGDVYAYRPASSTDYVVWVRQPSPAAEARFQPSAWAALWRAGLQPALVQQEEEAE